MVDKPTAKTTEVENDNTPPTGPQSGPLSPFGGNPSPALDAYVKGMTEGLPSTDETPTDPAAPIDQAAKRDDKRGDKK